jgi:hypothetical protein
MAEPTGTMFFLPYVPRSDSDARGYDQWIREVDNPFFNGVDGISLYANWKVAEVLKGEVDFTHFDFMYVDPAKEAQIWSNPEVAAFAQGWTDSWGKDPKNEDLSVNYHVYRMEQDGGAEGFSSKQVTVILQPAGAASPSAGRWKVVQAVLGQNAYDIVDVIYGPAPAGALDGAMAAFTGEIIAAP